MLGLVVASMLSQVAPWGTGESRGEDLTIWLTTFGPGEDIEHWWGHSAMVVEDGRLHSHRLYNYGMASFTPGFVRDFLRGRMVFWVADTDLVVGTYDRYRSLNRDVRTQELNLTPAQRLILSRALADNVLPQNREYLYHHYNDNCSTRPRDLIDQALGGQLKKAAAAPARMSLRKHTRRYTRLSPLVSLVLDYLQNDELDRPITQREEAFLPDELERQLDALKVLGADGSLQPAVARRENYFLAKTPGVPGEAPEWNGWLLLTGCGLGSLGLLLGHWAGKGRRPARFAWGLYNALLGLGWGSLGAMSLVLGLFTDNQVTQHNENLFLISPINLALLPLGVMASFGSRRARTGLRWTWAALAATGLLGVLLKVLPLFDQDNWNLILLVLPVSAAMAAGAWRDQRASAASAAGAAGGKSGVQPRKRRNRPV